MDQAGIKISGKNINNLRYTDPNGKGQRGTKKPLDEGERGEWKTWLNNQHLKNKDHGIWSHHSMANRREKMGWQTIFLGCKITADGDCSHEIKRHLLLEMKPCMAQMVKNLLAKQETWVQSLGWEDPLDMGWQLTPVFLPGKSHGQRSVVGYSPQGSQWVGHDWATNTANTAPWKKSHDKPREHTKKQRHLFVEKGPRSQRYIFSNNHVWLWELDHKEGWAEKN